MTTAIWIVFVIGTMTAAILAMGSELSTALFGLVVIVGCLAYLGFKTEQAQRQLRELTRLKAAYDQLDQSAKLIIRADLELHRTQEALDQRLASLMQLHHLGRQLQVSLRPDEVYAKLDTATLTQFGFSKGLLGLCPTSETLEWRSLIGISPEAAERLQQHLLASGALKHILTQPIPSILERSTATDPAHRQILELLGVPTAAVAGILPHAGPAGCLIVGRPGGRGAESQAEEELLAILTNQLATAVESSALFEEAWTAQRQLEHKVRERTRELADANAQLTRLNQAKSDFVSAVSHELRTPMAAIKGYAALLNTGQFGKLAAAQRDRLTKIEKHVDALTRLINNLLDIARIESGRITMEQHTIPIEDFLSGVHDLIRPQLDAKRIRYQTDSDGVAELWGDPQQLQRVFLNLLSNAVKYTPEGGSITVDVKRAGSSILATVADTGCGIGAEDAHKIFEEFYRVNDRLNQQVKGTGLGLALVKRIVEAHQGRISVTSHPGQGSVFSITLPAEQGSTT